MNNKFKGLYDNEKTSFMTDRTNDGFYEPEIKTPRIQVHNYSINFDKKELYAEIDRLNNIIDKQDRDITTLTKDKIKLNNIINELEKYCEEEQHIFRPTDKFAYSKVLDKLKELKEGNK